MLKFSVRVAHQYLETGNQITMSMNSITNSSIFLYGEPPSHWLCNCTRWLDQKCNQSRRCNTPRLPGGTGFFYCRRRCQRDQHLGAVNRLLTETCNKKEIRLHLNIERVLRKKGVFRLNSNCSYHCGTKKCAKLPKCGAKEGSVSSSTGCCQCNRG